MPIYKYPEIKFKNIEVSEMNREGSQPLAYINYNDVVRNVESKILIQSGKIRLTAHGIPPLHEKFAPTDEKREFMKIPLDPEQSTCVTLRKHLEAADEFFGSDEMMKKLFGKRADKYIYQPCVRTPQTIVDDDDDDDKKSKKENTSKIPRHDFCKMKFNMIVHDGKKILKTKVEKVVTANGKSQNKLIKPETITDLAEEIRLFSEVNFIFYYSKVWANTVPSQGSKFIPYGVGFKIMAIRFTPSANRGINVDGLEIMSEEDEADEDQPKNKMKSDKMKSDKMKADGKAKNKSKSNEEDEDIPDKKTSKKPAKKPAKKQAKDDEEPDGLDEDDEEEIRPKKKPKKATKVNDDVDDDEVAEEEQEEPEEEPEEPEEPDEEEEIKPKKKEKKTQRRN